MWALWRREGSNAPAPVSVCITVLILFGYIIHTSQPYPANYSKQKTLETLVRHLRRSNSFPLHRPMTKEEILAARPDLVDKLKHFFKAIDVNPVAISRMTGKHHRPRRHPGTASEERLEEVILPYIGDPDLGKDGAKLPEDMLDLDQLKGNAPPWSGNMIDFLWDVKKNGKDYFEVPGNKLEGLGLVTTRTGDNGQPVICKMEPFNVCYSKANGGQLLSAGTFKPIRMMRIY